MKELYLLILHKYKIWIIMGYFSFFLMGIYIQYFMNVLSLSSILAMALSYVFCLYSWFNGPFTYVLAISENSDNGEVLRRWFVIIMSSLCHVYMMVEPLS